MSYNTANPRLQEIADRIVQLKRFSEVTGTQSGKSQTALIAKLDPIELSVVASLVNQQLYADGMKKTEGSHAHPTK